MIKSLLFIDSRVTAYQSIIEALDAETAWVLIDAEHDGVLQMPAAASGYSGLSAIHVISHGSQGALYLGSTVLNSGNLANYGTQMAEIGMSLIDTGAILLYGCNVAQGDVGLQFIDSLAQYTGADVAASENATGTQALGGDWVLEQATGSVQAVGLSSNDLVGLLATTTFVNGGGKVKSDFSGSIDSITVQRDGKILAAGTLIVGTYPDSTSNFSLVRYNGDGSLDTNFGSGGKVTTDFSLSISDIGYTGTQSNDYAYSVTEQVDGKILVAGTGAIDFAVARYNSEGSLDTSFGGDGKITTEINGYGAVHKVIALASGKVFVAGTSSIGFGLARYNSDGSLDNAFSIDGKTRAYFGEVLECTSAIAQPDGKILVSGHQWYRTFNYSTASYDYWYSFVLARFNVDGSLDSSFDNDGNVTGVFYQGKANCVAVQSDGKILLAGQSNGDFALVRFNTDGSLDLTFDGDGKATLNFGGYTTDVIYEICLQADGKILVGGTSADNFALARYNVNGTLDASFDSDGRLTTDFGGSDTIRSITVRADGKILVGGSSGNGSLALALYNSDGSLDIGFGTPPDTTAPTVSISDNLNGIANLSINNLIYSLTFSEPITGLDTSDFNLTNGSISSVTGGGASWTVDVTPASGVASGTISLTLKVGAVSDAAGNQNGSFINASQILDTLAPTTTFTPADEANAVSVSSNIVANFSEGIQRGTGNITLKTTAGATLATYDAASSVNLSTSGNTLTINPSANLPYSTAYKLEFAAGTVKDLAGNAYAGTNTYNFTTIAAPGENFTGSSANDSYTSSAGNDTVNGGAGTDTVNYLGNRSGYTISKSTGGFNVADQTAGRNGTDSVQNVEVLHFADMSVDLTMGTQAASIPAASLKTLEELYVGFFNRVPEAAGLSYWIGQLKAGVSLTDIANQFYSAGVQFGVYSANMTNDQFITTVYANVLGRSGATAPPQADINYWANRLIAGTDTKGTMVLTMLHDSHAFFTNDPVVGWVIDLLNNKATVANYFAVQQGLSYNVQQDNITHGIEIASAITPTDTAAALALIGVNAFDMG